MRLSDEQAREVLECLRVAVGEEPTMSNYLKDMRDRFQARPLVYAHPYVEALEVRVRELEAALTGMAALMDRSDGVAYISDGPNGQETGSIHWEWHEEAQAVVGIVGALAAVDAEKGNDDG